MDRTEAEKILSEGTSNPQYQVALNMAKEKGWLNDRNTTDAKMPVEETKEEKKKRKQEEKAKKEEATRQWMLDRADVQNAVRRSQIANPSVGVVDRVMGNVTGRNEDLFDPNAVKAKDLNPDGTMANKNFQLGNGIEGNFIGVEEETKKGNKNADNNTANSSSSGSISNYDKNYLDAQSNRATYQANKELETQREGEKQRYEDLAKDFKYAQEGFKNIDDKMVESLPTFMVRHYQNGEFGEPGSKDAKLRLAHFMINGVGTALQNASAVIKGGQMQESDIEKFNNTNLEQGLSNRWYKNKAETESAVEALKKQGIEEQDIRNSINKIATNARMQTAFNMMNEEQKIHAIKVIAEIGDKIKNFDNDELATFMTGAMLSDKNFSNEDLLTAVGLKFGTDFMDSDTANQIGDKLKRLMGIK